MTRCNFHAMPESSAAERLGVALDSARSITWHSSDTVLEPHVEANTHVEVAWLPSFPAFQKSLYDRGRKKVTAPSRVVCMWLPAYTMHANPGPLWTAMASRMSSGSDMSVASLLTRFVPIALMRVSGLAWDLSMTGTEGDL